MDLKHSMTDKTEDKTSKLNTALTSGYYCQILVNLETTGNSKLHIFAKSYCV